MLLVGRKTNIGQPLYWRSGRFCLAHQTICASIGGLFDLGHKVGRALYAKVPKIVCRMNQGFGFYRPQNHALFVKGEGGDVAPKHRIVLKPGLRIREIHGRDFDPALFRCMADSHEGFGSIQIADARNDEPVFCEPLNVFVKLLIPHPRRRESLLLELRRLSQVLCKTLSMVLIEVKDFGPFRGTISRHDLLPNGFALIRRFQQLQEHFGGVCHGKKCCIQPVHAHHIGINVQKPHGLGLCCGSQRVILVSTHSHMTPFSCPGRKHWEKQIVSAFIGPKKMPLDFPFGLIFEFACRRDNLQLPGFRCFRFRPGRKQKECKTEPRKALHRNIVFCHANAGKTLERFPVGDCFWGSGKRLSLALFGSRFRTWERKDRQDQATDIESLAISVQEVLAVLASSSGNYWEANKMKPQPLDRETTTPKEPAVELRSLVGKAEDAAHVVRAEAGAATVVAGHETEAAPAATALALPLKEERYVMQRLLGEGAMGEVFAAKDAFLRRRVAFKRMNQAVAKSPPLAARFLKEAQITAQLEHPNIIPIYGLEATADGSVGYAMKFIEGQNLTSLLDTDRQKAGKISPVDEQANIANRLRIFTRICDAIAYAHAKGVLHRDLKPDNVMIGLFNQVYVVDWGICRLMNTPDEPLTEANIETNNSQNTRYGSVIGTPAYMSPEQASGKHSELDGRSDLYALGLILFEVVTLRQAVTGDSVQDVLVKAVQGQKNPLIHLDPHVKIPLELRAIIFKATALSPSNRYANIGEFAADLRRYRNGEAVLALPDTVLLKTLRVMNRHKGATLASLVILLLVGLGAILFLQLRHAAQVATERRHRQKLQALMLSVSQHGHRIDNQLHDYEGLVHGLAGRTIEAMRHSAQNPGIADTGTKGRKGAGSKKTDKPEKPEKADKAEKAAKKKKRGKTEASGEVATTASTNVYFSEDFSTPGRGPKDLAENARYGQKISMEYPVFKLAPQVSADAARRDLDTLAGLGQGFQTTFQHSKNGLYRLFVTLSNGVHVAYPGRGGFPASYDGRDRPKYTLAANQRELRWGNVYLDLFDEPLIACSFPLYSDTNKFLGVAGVDLLLPEIAEQLLVMPQVPAAKQVLLVDSHGKIGVSWPEGVKVSRREGDVGTLHRNRTLELKPLPYPEVIAAFSEEPAGGYKELPREVVAYYPVSSLGWFLVVVADRKTLFQGRAR